MNDVNERKPEGNKMTEQEFISSIPNPRTRKEYANGLKKFSEWYGKTADEILNLRREDWQSTDRFQRRRFEREIENFYAYLKEQGYGTNSCRTLCLGIRQCFRYYEMPITLKRGSEVGKRVLTDKSYGLTIEDLRRMFAVADLKQRVILSVGKDLALRIGDFRRLKRNDLPDLNQEPPIEPPIPFDVMTRKEEVLAKAHLSHETVELLKSYLPTIADKTNPYLFPTNGKGPISEDAISWNLKELAKKAGVTVPKGKHLTFHCFRKLFLSTAKNLNVDTDIAKALCGKSVKADILTYMTVVQWREAFSKIVDALKIQALPNRNKVRLEELEEKVTKLSEQNRLLVALMEEQSKRLAELDPKHKEKMEKIRKIINELRSWQV